MRRHPLVLLALAFAACQPAESPGLDVSDADTDTDADADSDADTDSDADSDADADTDTDPLVDTGLPAETDCADGIDNDLDTVADCEDYDCLADPVCIDACPPEDTLEDNDDVQSATTGVTSASDLMVHRQDPDFFAIGTLQPGELARATTTFTHADGDVQLALVDAQGNVLDSGSSFSDDERAEWVNDGSQPLDVFARVTVWWGGARECNAYGIDLYGGPIPGETCDSGIDDDLDGLLGCADPDCMGDAACPACPPEDAFEPNDLASAAVPIESATDLGIHATNADFYKAEVALGDIVEVNAAYDTSAGELELTLRNANGQIVGYDTGGGALHIAVPEGGAPGTWTVEVRVVSGDCNRYDLDLHVTTPPSETCDDGLDNDLDGATDCNDYECIGTVACEDVCPSEDPVEPNDDFGTALPIGFVTGLATFAQNDDWFYADSGEDHLVEANVRWSAEDGGPLVIRLYDGDHTLVAEDTSGSETLRVTALNTAAHDRYFLQVTPDPTAPAACNTYDLEGFFSVPPPTETCDDLVDNDGDLLADCDDYDCLVQAPCTDVCPAEDANLGLNGSFETAATDAVLTGGMTHIQGQDWYRFVVAPGESADIRVAFTHADGDLGVTFFDDEGTVYTASSSTDDEVWSVANFTDAPVTYTANVYPEAGVTCGAYDWSADVHPIPAESCHDTADNDFDGWLDCSDYDCIDDAACIASLPTCPGEDASGRTSPTAPLVFDPAVGFAGMTVHKQQSDWYTFDLAPGAHIDLHADFVDVTADIFLRLYDTDLAELQRVDSFNDDEDMVVLNRTGATLTYVLEVGVDDITYDCNTYSLSATSYGPIPAEDCTDLADNDFDGFDDCDDYDCIEEAACIAATPTCPGEDVHSGLHSTPETALPFGTYTDMTVHEQVPDWYEVTVPAGEYLTALVSFVDAPANLYAEAYDANGVRVARAQTSTDDEVLTILNPSAAPATYSVLVGVDDYNRYCNTYSIAATASGPIPDEVCDDLEDNDFDTFVDCKDYGCGTTEPTCGCPAEDSLEPNDSVATALTGVTNATGLGVFWENLDYYGYTVEPGQTVSFDAFFVHASGNINLRLTTTQGVQLATGSTTTDNEHVQWTNTTSTPYDVAVEVKLAPFETRGCSTYDVMASVQ
ncbi:MAG: hypothetical protein R3F61_29575 [Myxococcota bacterium]